MSRYLEGTLNVFNLPYLTCPLARYSESAPIDTAHNVFQINLTFAMIE